VSGGDENDLPLVGHASDDLVGHRGPQAVPEEDQRSVLANRSECFGHLIREDVNIGEERLSLAFRPPRVLHASRLGHVSHLRREALVGAGGAA